MLFVANNLHLLAGGRVRPVKLQVTWWVVIVHNSEPLYESQFQYCIHPGLLALMKILAYSRHSNKCWNWAADEHVWWSWSWYFNSKRAWWLGLFFLSLIYPPVHHHYHKLLRDLITSNWFLWPMFCSTARRTLCHPAVAASRNGLLWHPGEH